MYRSGSPSMIKSESECQWSKGLKTQYKPYVAKDKELLKFIRQAVKTGSHHSNIKIFIKNSPLLKK